MLLRDERSCQAHCLDGRRSVSVADSARGGNLDVAAADKRPAANRSQETNLQRHRPLDFCLPLSASPWGSRCAGDCQAGDRSQMASRRVPIILAMEIESAGWQANDSVGDTQAYPRDGLRVGLRKWKNGLTVVSVILMYLRPSRALSRMRSDARGYP